MYLLERGPKDLVELTTWAQKYLIAHKEQLGKSKATVQPRHADQKKTTQSKPDSSQGKATRSKRNSEKSGTEGSTNSDRAVYSAVCHAQSNDGQTYVGVGKLNGRPGKVLRDTGFTGMIVDKALVPEVMVIPGSSGSPQMMDHTLIQ